MKSLPKNLVVAVGVAVLLIGVLFVAAYATPAPVLQIVDVPQQGAVTTTVAAKTDLTTTEKSPVVPFLADWQKGGHSDITAEAFNHWPAGEVPVDCAKCHTSEGYRDFVGADGSKVGVVDAAVKNSGSLIDCVACHNTGTINKTSVKFPSGIEIQNLGDESRCMECHQGRESKLSVNKQITDTFKLTAKDEDTVVKPLITTDASGKTVTTTFGFRNVHYFAAAATQYGTLVKGGYEYDGHSYDGKFQHPAPYDTCMGCHNQHTLELRWKNAPPAIRG